MTLTPIRKLVKRTKQISPTSLGRETFIYVDISSVDKDTKTITSPQNLPVGEAPSRARKGIKFNDVLVATVRPNLNGVAIVPNGYHNEIASTGFCVLRPDQTKLDPHYLFYFTQTGRFVSHLTKLSIGAGYPAVSDEDILDTEIPLPPLNEQQRIATRLAKADRLRRLRRYASQLGESYLQSVFLEMFGDIRSNPKGWKISTLANENTNFIYGTSAKCDYQHVGLPVLRIPNILSGSITLDDLKYAELSEKEIKSITLKNGDIVFVRTNGNPDYVGRCAVFNLSEQYLFASYLIRARVNQKKINPTFLLTYLHTAKGREAMNPYIRTTAGQSNIGMEGLGQIPVPLPPLAEQERFAAVVAQYERLRAQMSEAERQGEMLFQSLLHEAFAEGAYPTGMISHHV